MYILYNKPQTVTSPSYTVWPWAVHTMSQLWEKPYMAAGKASSLRENVKMSTRVKHTNKNIHPCNWNSLYCGLKIWAVYKFSNFQWVFIHSQEKTFNPLWKGKLSVTAHNISKVQSYYIEERIWWHHVKCPLTWTFHISAVRSESWTAVPQRHIQMSIEAAMLRLKVHW